PQHLERGIAPDAQHRKERFARAVPAQQEDPGPEGAVGRPEVDLPTVAPHRAEGALDPGEAAEQLVLAVSLRPRDADDLASAHAQVERTEATALESRELDDDILTVASRALAVRERELERPPDHQRDERLLRHR